MTKITLEFDQEDVNSLATLMDAGVKALGLSVVKSAATLVFKLETAVAAANQNASTIDNNILTKQP